MQLLLRGESEGSHVIIVLRVTRRAIVDGDVVHGSHGGRVVLREVLVLGVVVLRLQGILRSESHWWLNEIVVVGLKIRCL